MTLSAKIIKEVLLKSNGAEVLPGLVCKVLDKTHIGQVNEVLSSDYVNNPVYEMFNLSKKEVQFSQAKAAEKYLKSNSSLGFIEKQTNGLVAMMITSVESKTDGDPPHEITPALSDPLAEKLRFINQLFGDVFHDLNTDCYMRGRFTYTKWDYRSRGLAGILAEIMSSLAKEKGCEYYVSFVGSLYLQMAAKSEGCRVLREVRYDDYVDPYTGLKPDLKLSPIHKTAQVVYKKI